MKVYIRTPNLEAQEDEAQYTEKEMTDLKAAISAKKTGEKIHLCYHNETPVRPCELI